MNIWDAALKERAAAADWMSAACMSDRVAMARSINHRDTGRRLDRVLSTTTTRTRPCASL
jgi:hypothetical protein